MRDCILSNIIGQFTNALVGLIKYMLGLSKIMIVFKYNMIILKYYDTITI